MKFAHHADGRRLQVVADNLTQVVVVDTTGRFEIWPMGWIKKIEHVHEGPRIPQPRGGR